MTTKDYQKRSELRIFFSYFKPHRRLFLTDLSCAVLMSMVDLAFPLLSRWALYDLIPNQQFRTFFILMAGVILAYVVRSLLNYIVCYWGHTFGIRVEADIRRDLFAHMQELGFDFYDQNRTGQMMSRLTSDLFDLTELAHHGPEDLLISLFTICGALVVMFTIQWRLALVMAIMIPIFLVIVATQRKSMMNTSREVKQKIGHINTEIESSLTGIRTAKAFANEQVENQRFSRANDQYKGSKREFQKAMGRFSSWLEFFLCSMNVVVIAVGGYLIMKGQMKAVDLLTFTLYTGSFINPIRKLANFSEIFASGLMDPNHARYQTSPHPDSLHYYRGKGWICQGKGSENRRKSCGAAMGCERRRGQGRMGNGMFGGEGAYSFGEGGDAMERVVRREYTPAGEIVTTELLRTPERKPEGSWRRVLAWQAAVSLLLCLGAWCLGRWAPETAEQVREVLAAQEEDDISRAVRCLWENVAEGENVAQAVVEFYDELSHLS